MARQLIHGSVNAACVVEGRIHHRDRATVTRIGTIVCFHVRSNLAAQLTCVKNALYDHFQVDKFTDAKRLNCQQNGL